MPELPEVETTARGIQQRVAGETIESVWIGRERNLLKSPAAEIARMLEGARIARVHRVGKHLVIDLLPASRGGGRVGSTKAPHLPTARRCGAPGSAQWIVHLGMTGRMLVCDAAEPRVKHTHLVAELSSGRELRFVDPRRFGRLEVRTGGPFEAAGCEPIGADRDHFVSLFRGRQTPIKSALLNQKLLTGIGNIYADESLFRTGVRPRRRAASLTRRELLALYDSIQEVLAEAIAAGGSSISDYVDAGGAAGYFQMMHRVYGREGEPCLACGTPIKRVVIAGRSSHYCPHCQR